MSLLSAFATNVASADGLRVAIVRSPDATLVVREATTRIGAELLAAGFDAVEVDAPSDADPRVAIEQAGEGAFATLALHPVPRSTSIDVWIADSMTHKTTVRRIAVPAKKKSDAPRFIALHAVELLRANLLEVQSPSKKTEDDTPDVEPVVVPKPVERLVTQNPDQPPPRPPPPAPPRFAFQAGVALVQGFDRVGTAAAPMLAGAFAFSDRADVQLSVVGPAFGANVNAPHGSASVRQELASFDIGYALAPRDGLLVPRIAIGAGAYHLFARGTATAPYRATSDDIWAALLEACTGAALRLGAHASLVLDARAMLFFPRPVIALADAQPASTGRPTLTVSLGVLASF